MSMVGFSRTCALVVVLCGLTACSEDAAPGGDGELPDEVSAEVDEQGAMLKVNGLTLEIPEGALEKKLTISVKKQGQAAPAETKTKQLSDVYAFEPSGTKFKKDVTVAFETERHETKAAVYFTKEGSSEFEKLPSETQENTVSAKVRHFSRGFAGVPLEDFDAGPGDTDDAGRELDAGTGGGADAGVDGGVDGQSDAGVNKTRITVRSRDRFGIDVNQTWAAFQDGDGPWQFLAASGEAGHYAFDIAGSRYAVVFVCSDAALVNSWGTLRYEPAETTELEVTAQGGPCTAAAEPPRYVLDGSLNTGNYPYRRLGHALWTGWAESPSLSSYAVGEFVHNQPNDFMFASGPDDLSLARIGIERDLVLTGNRTINFDLEKSGFNVLGSATAVVLNASEVTNVEVRYTTRATIHGLPLSAGNAGGTTIRTVTFATLPEAERRAADRYLLDARETDQISWREVTYSTYATADLSVSMPDAFDVTFAAVDTPYLRPSYEFAPGADAALYSFSFSYMAARSYSHTFSIELDPAWLDGAATHTLVFPDLSGVPGFQSAWVPPSALGQASVDLKAAVRSEKSDAVGTLTTEAGTSGKLTQP